MTPMRKYQEILRDVERLLQERALRYFLTRFAGEESADLKVQCDTITVLLKQWLEPHRLWFEAYTEPPKTEEVLTLDLDDGTILGGQDAQY